MIFVAFKLGDRSSNREPLPVPIFLSKFLSILGILSQIFEEFLNEGISLRKLAGKHKFSVNGLKKILTNFTYIGKIKFDGQVHQGNHQPIVSTTLFNHVQNKLSKLTRNKK